MEKIAKIHILFSIFYLEKIRRMLSLQAALNELSATSQISICLTDFPAIVSLGIVGVDAFGRSYRGRPHALDIWHKRSANSPISKFKIGCFEKHKAVDFAIASG